MAKKKMKRPPKVVFADFPFSDSSKRVSIMREPNGDLYIETYAATHSMECLTIPAKDKVEFAEQLLLCARNKIYD